MTGPSGGHSESPAGWTRYGPYLIALVWLFAGYLHYLPGTAYSLSADHYRAWAFPAFRYSDVIWLYLRDNVMTQPLPYFDYPLEYPPLTGLLSWTVSWAPNLPAYFTIAYALLAASALLVIWALQRLPGANPWLFATAPALFFYTGHQWDLAAIAVTAISLVALQRERRTLAVAGLALATSLKLFPVAFFAALLVEAVRDRRWRQAGADIGIFAAISLVIHLPFALANSDNWLFFIRWNRDRLADSGLWVLWRDHSTVDLTRWSMVAAIAGGAALTYLALRQRGPLTVPLGATFLVWWLLVNKTFTTHLMLWVVLALALVSAPIWLWLSVNTIDIVGFQLGNFLNLYNIDTYRHAPLIRKAVENVYDPVQIGRSIVFGVGAFWFIQLLHDQSRRYAFAPRTPSSRRKPGHRFPSLEAAQPERALARAGVITALALLTALTLLITWPYAKLANTTTVAGFDPLLQVWISEWTQHALLTRPLGLYDANMFHPFARTLAYTDANIPGALVAFPIRAITGDPILTNTLLVLASFVLAGFGVFLLVRYLTGNQPVALISAVAYAFMPYRMIHLWHLNWLEGALLPWFMLALLRMVDKPSVRSAAATGIAAALLTLVSFYFALQIIIVAFALSMGVWIARRTWPELHFWKCAAAGLAVALAISIPFLAPYLQVNQEQRLERSLADAEQYKALPASYLQLPPWDEPNALQRQVGVRAAPNESLAEVGQAVHADGHQHQEIVSEDALFPGFIMLVFACVALLVGKPRWLSGALLAIALIAAVLSFGPSWGPRHTSNIALPYAWLYDHVPFFRAMRVPARLGGLVGLALVILAGLGLAVSWQRLAANFRPAQRRLAATFLSGCVLVLVLVDVWASGVPLEHIDRSPAATSGARWLANQPSGAVMEFPAESVFADPAAASVRRHTGEALLRSTIHWLPLVNGNSGFIPRTHSDFIERFVGTLPRHDGSYTGHISHITAETVQLLQQLEVRYVVFNVDQYAPADWEAVLAELEALTGAGLLQTPRAFGNQVIAVVNPLHPLPPSPNISLFAPTLLSPESPWSPWIAVDAAVTPTRLALTKPTRLAIRWYDGSGRLLDASHHTYPIPAVTDSPHLLCSTVACLTTRPVGDLTRLPQPEPAASWQPGVPGHYVVQASLTGDTPLNCQIDIDIVEDAAAQFTLAGGNRYRWAACVSGAPFPVNNPGQSLATIDQAEVALKGDILTLSFAITPGADELVDGWFILSPRGLAEPWKHASFESPHLQRLTKGGDVTSFSWTTSMLDVVEPGVYDITGWAHRLVAGEWEHAAGGPVAGDPLVVGNNGELRWAGPIRIGWAEPVPALVAGGRTTVPIQLTGVVNPEKCSASWILAAHDGSTTLGSIPYCNEFPITLPATLPEGRYEMTVNVYSADAVGFQVSDGLTTNVIVQLPTGGRRQ